jgi:hypothetical protein
MGQVNANRWAVPCKLKMKSNSIVILFVTFILVSCSSNPRQVPTTSILATSTLLIPESTMTNQTLIETPAPTIANPESTKYLCTPEDFSSSLATISLDNLESLIGYRPYRNWLPSEGWKKTIGVSNRTDHYLLQGYKNNANQHLFVLEKPICRYGENGKYGLSEIVDFILLPALEEDDIIIWSLNTESCCFLQPAISDRLEFRFEWFTLAECNPSLPNAIMLAKYNLVGLPPKIVVGDGYKLPVKIIKGWQPNMYIETFKEFETEDISCAISFMGR